MLFFYGIFISLKRRNDTESWGYSSDLPSFCLGVIMSEPESQSPAHLASLQSPLLLHPSISAHLLSYQSDSGFLSLDQSPGVSHLLPELSAKLERCLPQLCLERIWSWLLFHIELRAVAVWEVFSKDSAGTDHRSLTDGESSSSKISRDFRQ